MLALHVHAAHLNFNIHGMFNMKNQGLNPSLSHISTNVLLTSE